MFLFALYLIKFVPLRCNNLFLEEVWLRQQPKKQKSQNNYWQTTQTHTRKTSNAHASLMFSWEGLRWIFLKCKTRYLVPSFIQAAIGSDSPKHVYRLYIDLCHQFEKNTFLINLSYSKLSRESKSNILHDPMVPCYYSWGLFGLFGALFPFLCTLVQQHVDNFQLTTSNFALNGVWSWAFQTVCHFNIEVFYVFYILSWLTSSTPWNTTNIQRAHKQDCFPC